MLSCPSLLFDLNVYFLYVFNNRLNIINCISIMSISNKYYLSIYYDSSDIRNYLPSNIYNTHLIWRLHESDRSGWRDENLLSPVKVWVPLVRTWRSALRIQDTWTIKLQYVAVNKEYNFENIFFLKCRVFYAGLTLTMSQHIFFKAINKNFTKYTHNKYYYLCKIPKKRNEDSRIRPNLKLKYIISLKKGIQTKQKFVNFF